MGGCNNNNNNNNKLIRLYGKVSVRKCKNFLQNRKGTRSNNTAELSGIAEAILYGLQELRKPNPPRIKEFMIRPDSEYAQLSVQGLTQPAENIQMVQEIKRHYADLKSVCAAQDINITWLHVPAHEHFRWNDLADEIAKDASRPNKLQHVRASARNERTPTPDPRGTFRNEQIRAAPVRHPQFIPPIDNMQVPDHLDVPEDADLFETYATTPIHLIPAEHIGILCALAPTKNITKKSKHVRKIRSCFNMIVNEARKDNNAQDSIWWRKIIFLPRVLFTPANANCNLTLVDRCNLVLGNDWSSFTFNSFIRRTFATPGPQDDSKFDSMREKRSMTYLQAGEISRGFKALTAQNHPIPETEEVFRKLVALHPQRPAESIIPDPPGDLPHMELSAQEVKSTIQKTKNCVTNCPITSLRYERNPQASNRTIQ